MKHPVTTTHNGALVYVDLIKSPAATIIARQPQLVRLVTEVLRQTRVDSEKMVIEQDMQRDIGYETVVATAGTDNVFYAKLVRESFYTRFVKHSSLATTKYLSIVLHRDSEGEYELQHVWIGKQRPAFPGEEGETSESQAFWSKHAFALEGQQLQPRTVTRTCPY